MYSTTVHRRRACGTRLWQSDSILCHSALSLEPSDTHPIGQELAVIYTCNNWQTATLGKHSCRHGSCRTATIAAVTRGACTLHSNSWTELAKLVQPWHSKRRGESQLDTHVNNLALVRATLTFGSMDSAQTANVNGSGALPIFAEGRI